MSSSADTTQYRHLKGALGCFTTSKRGILLYGRLLHNIGYAWSDDYGTFFLEDGNVQTYRVNFVDQVTLRLTQEDIAFSEYLQGAVNGDIRLRHAEREFNASSDAKGKDESASESTLQQMMKTSLELFRNKNPLQQPKAPLPVRPKSLFPVKNKTRETKVAGRTGPKAHYRQLEAETQCGWCLGTLLKFDPGDVTPYTVRWNTKPMQNMMVSASTIKQLVANYRWCNTREVFEGIVGREVLWPTFKGNAAILRYTKVIAYDPLLKLYDVSFRDGIIFQITPETLDEVTERHDVILKGGEVVVDDANKISRMVRYTQIHVHHAKQEKKNYKVQGPVLLSNNKSGSDFDTDTDNVDESANNSESYPQASKSTFAVKSATKFKPCFAALTVKESQSNPKLTTNGDVSDSDEDVPLTEEVAIVMQREMEKKEMARVQSREQVATLAQRTKKQPEILKEADILEQQKKEQAEQLRDKATQDAQFVQEQKEEESLQALDDAKSEQDQVDTARIQAIATALVNSSSESKMLIEQQEAARFKESEEQQLRELQQKEQPQILKDKDNDEDRVLQAEKEAARLKATQDAKYVQEQKEEERLKALDDAKSVQDEVETARLQAIATALVNSTSESKMVIEQQEAARLKEIEEQQLRELQQEEQGQILKDKDNDEDRVLQDDKEPARLKAIEEHQTSEQQQKDVHDVMGLNICTWVFAKQLPDGLATDADGLWISGKVVGELPTVNGERQYIGQYEEPYSACVSLTSIDAN
jgi:hypothetical protein